jgi:hypothetical protein
MIYLIIKAALSGFIVMAVSEVARRGPGFGGLIASLPLVSILAMIRLWQDTADTERIAAQSEATSFGSSCRRCRCSWSFRQCSGTGWDFGPPSPFLAF